MVENRGGVVAMTIREEEVAKDIDTLLADTQEMKSHG